MHLMLLPLQDDCSTLRTCQVSLNAQEDDSHHRIGNVQTLLSQLESRLGFSATSPRFGSEGMDQTPSTRPGALVEAPVISVLDRLNRLERRCEVRGSIGICVFSSVFKVQTALALSIKCFEAASNLAPKLCRQLVGSCLYIRIPPVICPCLLSAQPEDMLPHADVPRQRCCASLTVRKAKRY